MKALIITIVTVLGISAVADQGKEQEQQEEQSSQQYAEADTTRDYGYGYGYGFGFGPSRTVRWQLVDSTKAPKVIDESVSIYIGGRLVNEIILRADKSPVDISDAVAYLSNGQRIDLYPGSADLRNGESRRFRLDYRYSLRVERIEFKLSSPRLIGSRGVLNTYVGFAE